MKIVLFDRGSAKWINIGLDKPVTFHSSIEDGTRFDVSFANDKEALRNVIYDNNLDWLLPTLEFHNVEQKDIFWRYVSNFKVVL